ncbi:hypothetical protein BH11PSE9_BH11PSE9_14270 [soil metagenome]
MTNPGATNPLPADYFDGLSARARRVSLRIDGGALVIEAAEAPDEERGTAASGLDMAETVGTATAIDTALPTLPPRATAASFTALRVPLRDVLWPERTRHGPRTAHLRDGGSVQALDAAAWDAWTRAAGLGESVVVKAQQNWRATAMAVVLLLLIAAAGYQWGVPWMARAALAALPASVDRTIGDLALRSFDGQLLAPSSLPAARQAAITAAFDSAVERTHPAGDRPTYQLRFFASPKHSLGPNAFALPGGTIVVTDELVHLLAGRDDVLLGVLGHELGHVQQRHGMRLLLQTAVIGTAASLAWGDFSWLLAAAPAVLGQNAYSRDFERQADGEAITLLRANGISPAVMIELFERLAEQRVFDKPPAGEGQAASDAGDGSSDAPRSGASGTPGDTAKRAPRFDLGIALASHPADAERMQRFREAAR